MTLQYQAYGAAGEVTGSKHHFTYRGKRILFDCGMFQGRREESDEKNRTLPFSAAALDAVVLSHGHFDHCGNLPTLVRHGYNGNIYATAATRDIANLVLMDSAHIMAKDYEWLTKKAPQKKAFPPVFDTRDVVATLDRFVTLGWHRRFPLPGDSAAEFYNSGHILGSSMVQFSFQGEDGGGRQLLFTGDLGRAGLPIIPDPEPFPPCDYLICESTYGNRLHDSIDDAQTQLAEVINDTVKRGGKIIIPSFAVGRTQELIYFLHLLRDANRIPELNVYVDSPMAVNATAIFKVHQECYDAEVNQAFIDHHENPFGFSKLHYVSDAESSKQLNDRQEPCIIISSSGMCEGGRILHHLRNYVGDPRHTILVVGFMAANTLGRAIADRNPTVKIFGDEYPLRARVKILNVFSGHADYHDLVNAIGRTDLRRLRCAYLVHGEKDAAENLRGLFLKKGVRKVEIVQPGHVYKMT